MGQRRIAFSTTLELPSSSGASARTCHLKIAMSDDIAQIVILSMSETALLYRRVRTLHNLGLDVALTTRRWVKLDRKYSCQLLNVERPNSRNETEGTHAAFSLNECPIWFVQSGGQSVQSIAN